MIQAMRSVRLLALLFLAGAAARAEVAPPPPEARAEKELGDARRKAGDEVGALDAYRAALKLHGGYADAYEAVGELQYKWRAYSDAVETFGYVVEIDPGYALAWYNLGFAARKVGKLAKARDSFARYVKLRPADADGHRGLAESARALGDGPAAIGEYEMFVNLAQANPAQAQSVAKAKEAIAALRAAGAPPHAGAAAGSTAVPEPSRPAIASAAPGDLPPLHRAERGARRGEASAARSLAAPASPAFLDKLALGDKAYAAGDVRGALFAYQDAVYLDARSAAARVKLGRAYLAMRYPALATEQLEQALAVDPENEEGRRALEEARGAPPGVAPAVLPAANGPARPAAAPVAAATTAAREPSAPRARVYRFAPVAEQPAAQDPAAAPAAAVRADAPAAPVRTQPDAAGFPASAEGRLDAPSPATARAFSADAPAAEGGPTVAQRYRAALDLISRHEYAKAVEQLNEAIAQDPRLAVAYAARASAQFGLGRYREAADDYRAALGLKPDMATPLYGLAECYRLLGDPAAGDLYLRYAESHAADVRDDLQNMARERAAEMGRRTAAP